MTTSRRHLLGGAAALAAAWVSGARAAEVDLNLPGGGGVRPLITDYPQKGAMILQRTRPPLLETPFEVFDEGTFTPNNRFWRIPHVHVLSRRLRSMLALNRRYVYSSNRHSTIPRSP